jgi:hypothetical protein
MIEQFEADDGGITDEALIGMLGSAFDEGRRGRAASDVLARGRRLRRRKRAVPAFGALGAVAVCAGLALALTGPSRPAGPAGAGSGEALRSNGAIVNVDEASFSVHTDAKTGLVTITFRQLFDEDALEPVLAEAGVRAVFNTPCDGPGIKSLNPFSVLSTRATGDDDAVFIIDPAKMPKGSVLDFSVSAGPFAPDKGVGVGLLSGVPTGACAPS